MKEITMPCEIVLFLGFGYVAHFAASLLKEDGLQIYGSSRDNTKIKKYNSLGYNIFSFNNEKAEDFIRAANYLVISIPPKAEGNIDVILEQFAPIISGSPNIKSIIYLSTTGVYGDYQGAWVNEDTLPNPTNQRSLLRLQSEQLWQRFSELNNINLQIFRLSGIYGPGRNALLQIKNGVAQSIFKPGQVFSRIHVKDIARLIQVAIHNYHLQGVFNLSDDYPCSPIEVNEYAAKLLNLPAPEIIQISEAKLSPLAKEFYSDCKKVRNDKIKQYFIKSLLFPDFKSGLEDLLVCDEKL